MVVAVVGASGFVGRATCAALRTLDVDVRSVTAPRLCSSATTGAGLAHESRSVDRRVRETLVAALEGAEVVVNAAGVAQATSKDGSVVLGANALLPTVLRDAAARAGAGRFIHVSSAAVQGRRAQLDETRAHDAFSPYSRSKILAEQSLLGTPSVIQTTILRPTSVHGSDRAVTRALAQFARSTVASVAGQGDHHSPQVLVENVGAAIAYLATSPLTPPPIVLQPSEGLTTASVLVALGGREPRHVPLPLAAGIIGAARATGRMSARSAGYARRLEMLWLGQDQVTGWLGETDWRPPAGYDRWRELGAELKHRG